MKGVKLTAALTAAAIAATLCIGPSSRAGLVDNWLTQKTETSPGYFEGQKRGFYTAGSFSARWPTGTDYPLTVTPPKVKAGCGGIDAFMGGFSFLNTDYLVQKLQRMIQAAPAIAFDMALSVLTEKLGTSMKDFENIINKLNNIQLNECALSKDVEVTLKKAGSGDKGGTMAGLLAAWGNDTGVTNLYTDVQKTLSSNHNNAGGTTVGQAAADPNSGNMSGCPQDVKDLFGSTGSVMERLGAKFGSSAYVDTIRGFMGDIKITNNNDGTYKVEYKAPCDIDKNDIKSFLNGETQAMDTNGSCYAANETNLTKWVTTMLSSIATKTKTKAPLSTEEDAFIQANPLPLGLITKLAVGTSQESAILGTLADVTAKAYAYEIAVELYNKVIGISEKAWQITTASSNAVPGADASKCQVKMVGDAPLLVENMEKKAYEMAATLRASYAAMVKETDSIMELSDRLKRFDDMARGSLTKSFGASLANRAVGR